jgi:nucleoside-diphosphate-sugar epimerase
MRVLLLGAAGCIGRELFASLAKRGHRVVPALRRAATAPPFATEPPIVVDLHRDTSAEAWMPRLAGIDAVVNCAEILQGPRAPSIDASDRLALIALFEACERSGVRRVVQISARGADPLRASALDWIVLRPSLVVARGACGATAALRALAALPFAIAVPGDGGQRIRPIDIDDLAALVAQALESDRLLRRTIAAVGPDVVTLRMLLEDYRSWLGFGKAPVVAIPRGIVKAFDAAPLEYDDTGDDAAFGEATEMQARGWKESLALHPAHAQDRWHARLYFVRPLLRASLAILWLASGFVGLFALRQWAPLMASALGTPVVLAGAALVLACLADVAVAMLLVRRWRPRRLALAQVLLICGYTAVATLLWPSLWLESLGPLLKNLPILGAVLALGAIEDER